jgi:tetratricopeptide (TPR) repeat protein
VLLPVLALAVLLSIPTLYAVAFVSGRVYLRRIRRQIRAIDRAGESEGPEAARAELVVWERRISKRDYNQLIVVARRWWVLDDHQRALAALDRIRFPWWFPTRAFRRAADELRYQVLRDAGRVAEAGSVFNRGLDRDPAAPWVAAARIEHAADAGDPQHLLAAFERSKAAALVQNPHLTLVAQVAKQAMRLGRHDEAITYTRRLLAELEAREGKPDGIVRTTTVVRSLAQLRAAIGALLMGAGDEAGAELEFERARIALDDEEGRRVIELLRAEGLVYARRFDEAAEVFDAIAREHDDGRAFAGLAMCRRRLGDLAGARVSLERARELAPELTSLRLLDAMLLADEGKRSEAEAALASERADLDDMLALAYVAVVLDLPSAEGSLRAAAAVYPGDEPDLAELLDRVAPDGRSWREHVEHPARPDVEADPGGSAGGSA